MFVRSHSARSASIALSVALTSLLAGCGGGGGSGGSTPETVQGLQIPSQVTLVEAQSTGSLRLPDGVLGATTYEDDPTEFWIRDDSMDALGTINVILCSVGQTNFSDPSVVNQGPYVALVACDERGGEQGGAGRGGDVVEYQRFVVDSSRESDTAPHIVKLWIDTPVSGPGNSRVPGVIYVKMTISSSPTEELPFGNFELVFKELRADQEHDDTDVGFKGFLATVPRTDGQAEFIFVDGEGDVNAALAVGEDAGQSRVRVVRSAAGGAGRAFSETLRAFNSGSGTQQSGTAYHLQFNSDFLARKKVDGTSETKVFDRNDFTASVYQYGVYDNDTGIKVEAQSGFGLENANGVQGWVGYYGLWFPDHVTLADGVVLTRRRRDADDETYNAVIVPGRLEKRTRITSTLGNLTGEDLEMFDPMTGQQVRIVWTGADLQKTAERSGESWVELSSPVSLLADYSEGDWLHLYSQARGGVELSWPESTPTDETAVFLLEHVTLDGGADELAGGNLTLFGYRQRLRSLITSAQANFESAESPFFPDASTVSEVKSYTFNATSLMLELDGDEVRLGDGVSVTGGPGEYGFECGPLFSTQLATLADEAEQTTTYFWRVGGEVWNQLRTVKDAGGEFVSFDAPLKLRYTHDEPSNTRFHGKTFTLEWDGNHLNGLPYDQDPMNQNHWRPGFTIPNGAVLTSGQASYKIKQLVGEQEMVEEGSPSAVITSQGFDLSVTLDPPADGYEEPGIGAMPEVTEAPKFVGGIVQTESEDS